MAAKFTTYAVLAGVNKRKKSCRGGSQSAGRGRGFTPTCTESQMLAMFGWTDPKMAAHDIAQENRESLGTAEMDTIAAFDRVARQFSCRCGRRTPGNSQAISAKMQLFHADCGFMVRSEGGRICCDFNGLAVA
jgi:hypothetical protein